MFVGLPSPAGQPYKFAGRAPEGSVLLRVFFGGALDPSAIDLTDAELSATAARELAGVLSISGPPQLTRVYRWREAGAQHDVEHPRRMAAFERRLAQLPGLFVAGSGFKTVGIPDCIADGRVTATAAASTL